MTLTAAHVEAPQSGHIGKHTHEGRGVDVVAVLVVAEARKRGPGFSVLIPEFANRAVVEDSLVIVAMRSPLVRFIPINSRHAGEAPTVSIHPWQEHG